MTYCVPMKDCMDLMRNVANEARVRHGVDLNEVVFPYIEQDQGIKIVYDADWLAKLHQAQGFDDVQESYIEFVSEAQYTFLLLKYSN